MVWGPAQDEARQIEMRPFSFKQFFIVPLLKSDAVNYNRSECEAVLPGNYGIIDTSYEEDESRSSIVYRDNSDVLYAVAYKSYIGKIGIQFCDIQDARNFVTYAYKYPNPSV